MVLCCVAVFPGEFQSSDYEMPDDAGKTETLFPLRLSSFLSAGDVLQNYRSSIVNWLAE